MIGRHITVSCRISLLPQTSATALAVDSKTAYTFFSPEKSQSIRTQPAFHVFNLLIILETAIQTVVKKQAKGQNGFASIAETCYHSSSIKAAMKKKKKADAESRLDALFILCASYFYPIIPCFLGTEAAKSYQATSKTEASFFKRLPAKQRIYYQPNQIKPHL